ncbi:MAG: hypothetical protein QJR12_07265 [Mycobacterium sp.]|uniref:hypothetical protein n=1 Tax=Mycobacterium sp. TaxID=1785 RepID=UPI00261F7464|nr:hypothetical protein [Mycobacterium sp.]MDI3314072.1 hypothetical protein [Mycobacterium sp.]
MPDPRARGPRAALRWYPMGAGRAPQLTVGGGRAPQHPMGAGRAPQLTVAAALAQIGNVDGTRSAPT